MTADTERRDRSISTEHRTAGPRACAARRQPEPRTSPTSTQYSCPLPIDYEWYGRSFDGLDYRFIEPLSRHAPEDYARALDWFPLAELELLRHDLTR
ncbi:hypothetical protein [Amycolatopsis lurida]|uniref:hypothetical protein n=1 Tax=Amycolatopsis lurida TaxID=31959 RepID=UPI0036533338